MVNPLAHKARVQGLYKRCIKEYLNWGYQRDYFYEAVGIECLFGVSTLNTCGVGTHQRPIQVENIRGQFEAKKHVVRRVLSAQCIHISTYVQDLVQGERLADRLEAYLNSIQHPDPYTGAFVCKLNVSPLHAYPQHHTCMAARSMRATHHSPPA